MPPDRVAVTESPPPFRYGVSHIGDDYHYRNSDNEILSIVVDRLRHRTSTIYEHLESKNETLMSRPLRYLCPDELHQLFTYNPETGFITSKKTGWTYGRETENAYIGITYRRGAVPAHRVAYVLMTGQQPLWIDHINAVKHDNRWVNLRSVTISENSLNRWRHAKERALCRQ